MSARRPRGMTICLPLKISPFCVVSSSRMYGTKVGGTSHVFSGHPCVMICFIVPISLYFQLDLLQVFHSNRQVFHTFEKGARQHVSYVHVCSFGVNNLRVVLHKTHHHSLKSARSFRQGFPHQKFMVTLNECKLAKYVLLKSF